MMSFLAELKQRNVIRVGTAYIVVSWLLIQVVETVFPAFGFDDSAIRISVIILAIGFLPALILAWVFELTPEGLIKETDLDRSQSITSRSSKKLDRLIIVVLVLAVAYFAIDKFVLNAGRGVEPQPAASSSLASIAVLPFVDMSRSGDQQYLSDGLSEELLNLLAQIPELRVASRSSAFNLRDSGLSVPEMAQKLMVAHILEGSVRMAGEKLRVTVQLIDAATDSHLWSNTYDRTFDDVFAIQDDIASQVVQQLEVKLLGAPPRAPDVDPEAYDLYLKAQHIMNRRVAEEAPEATQLLKRAVAIDPGFANAWFRLSGNYQRQVTFDQISREEGLAKSRAALKMAAQLDPNSKRVQGRSAWMAMRWDRDFEKAVYHAQKRIDLEDKPMDKVGVAYDIMRFLYMYDVLSLFCEFMVAREPTDSNAHHCLAEAYLTLKQCDRAYLHADMALTLTPDMWNAQPYLMEALACQGRWDQVLLEAEKFSEEDYAWFFEAQALVALGRNDEAEKSIQKMRQAESPSWSDLALIYAQQGDLDSAFDALDRWAEKKPNPWGVANNDGLDSLRGDSRWHDFEVLIKGTPEELARLKIDLPIPEELRALDPECKILEYKKEQYCD